MAHTGASDPQRENLGQAASDHVRPLWGFCFIAAV